MLNAIEIDNTIYELEHGKTTFETCQRLANLYIVRDHITAEKQTAGEQRNTESEAVVKEYKDILPEYKNYIAVKTQYQMHQIDAQSVITSLQTVCKEIQEFIQTLYSSTDMPAERALIIQSQTNIMNMLQ